MTQPILIPRHQYSEPLLVVELKPGYIHGATDELGYDAVSGKVHIHDLHATMLHQLGIEHNQFTYKFQGLDARLSGVDGAKVIKSIIT